MKKILLMAVAVLFSTGAFAQDWSVGARVGSGFQAVGQYNLNSKNYVEARFGASWIDGGVTADFTALYNWHILDMNWTPTAGTWFFDAGCGVNVGGKGHFAYVGVAGMARLGITFHKVPISLSIDYTPVIGPQFAYGKYPAVPDYSDVWGYTRASNNSKRYTHTSFRGRGFANVGITCTYNF